MHEKCELLVSFDNMTVFLQRNATCDGLPSTRSFSAASLDNEKNLHVNVMSEINENLTLLYRRHVTLMSCYVTHIPWVAGASGALSSDF